MCLKYFFILIRINLRLSNFSKKESLRILKILFFTLINFFSYLLYATQCVDFISNSNPHGQSIVSSKITESQDFDISSIKLLELAQKDLVFIEATITTVDGSIKWHAQWQYERLSALPKRQRNFFKRLKQKSKPGTYKNREMGGFITEFEDGTSKGAYFTSNLYAEIKSGDWISARDLSNVDSNGLVPPTRYIHVHTHPWDLKVTTMVPSPADINFYKEIISSNDGWDIEVRGKNGGNAEFVAYILPVCEGCEDIIIKMTRENIMASRGKIDN